MASIDMAEADREASYIAGPVWTGRPRRPELALFDQLRLVVCFNDARGPGFRLTWFHQELLWNLANRLEREWRKTMRGAGAVAASLSQPAAQYFVRNSHSFKYPSHAETPR